MDFNLRFLRLDCHFHHSDNDKNQKTQMFKFLVMKRVCIFQYLKVNTTLWNLKVNTTLTQKFCKVNFTKK